MSGEGRRSNQTADAQQFPPAGAESARAAENDAGENGAEIRWVGEQRLMHGYCGRATFTGRTAPRGPAEQAPVTRPPVLLQGPRRRVIRIAPRPAATEGQATARAA